MAKRSVGYKAVGSGSATGASFDASSFSVYIVAGVLEDYRLLVKFVSPLKTDNNGLIASMYVKENDNMEQVLYDPGVGTLADGVYFRGWTTEENYTTETTPLTIAEVRAAVSEMLPQSAPPKSASDSGVALLRCRAYRTACAGALRKPDG